MPVLKANVDGQWVPLIAGRDGAQGPPGPASPHEGSNIAVGVRQHGAVGDGTTDDTAAVQAAIDAAGPYGWVDFEAGTYKITASITNWWRVRKTGPGMITDGTETQLVSPRHYGDYITVYINSETGTSNASGLSPSQSMKSLTDLNTFFELIDTMQYSRGRLKVRMSGTFDGARIQNLPRTGLPVEFEGDPLVNGKPVTTIQRGTAAIGIQVQPAIGRTAIFRNLAFKNFTGGSGFGFLWSEGGSVRIEDCAAENCGSGIVIRNNATGNVLRTTADGCTVSAFRAQYSASVTWNNSKATNSNEGFHVSRNAVAHADYIDASGNTRDGLFVDMSSRLAVKGPSTIHRNGREGARAEGGSDLHLDTSEGTIDFGTGTANANTRRGWGLYGAARLTTDHSIYGAVEYMLDSYRGTRTTAWAAQRGIDKDHCGLGARIRVVTIGQGAGSVQLRIGAGTFATVTVPDGDWRIEMVATHNGTQWEGRTTLGATTTVRTLTQGKVDSIPTVTPTGCTVREIEAWTGS